MATHKSAAKRARQSLRKYARNSGARAALKTAEKRLRKAVQGKDTDAAQTLYREAISGLDRAASKGVIHFKKAQRKASRLATLLSANR